MKEREEALLKIRDVAQRLQCSPSTVMRMIKCNPDFPFVPVGHRGYRFVWDEVLSYLRNGRRTNKDLDFPGLD